MYLSSETLFKRYVKTLVQCYDDVLKPGYAVYLNFTPFPTGKIIQIQVEKRDSYFFNENPESFSLNDGLNSTGIELFDDNEEEVEKVVGTKIIIDNATTIIIKEDNRDEWMRKNALVDFKQIMRNTLSL